MISNITTDTKVVELSRKTVSITGNGSMNSDFKTNKQVKKTLNNSNTLMFQGEKVDLYEKYLSSVYTKLLNMMKHITQY